MFHSSTFIFFVFFFNHRLSKIIIYQMSVCPSIPECIRSFSIRFSSERSQKIQNFRRLWIVLSDSGVFIIIFRESAETRFPGKYRKIKFLHFKHFNVCYQAKKDPWFRIFSIHVIGNYREARICRILGKFR